MSAFRCYPPNVPFKATLIRYKAADIKYPDSFSHHSEADLNPKNGKDNIVTDENSITPDEEAPQHRKIGPAPDEEAYATDMEAVECRNL